MPPQRHPIGLHLVRSARLVSRAFDDALAAAGGSLPMWLVLLQLKIRSVANQRELAVAVGVTAPTLTHHLNAMEQAGLLVRRRDPASRRNHIIALTDAGEQAFFRLRDAAAAFDERLRTGFDAEELAGLSAQLNRLCANASDDDDEARWAGPISPGIDHPPRPRSTRRGSPGPRSH